MISYKSMLIIIYFNEYKDEYLLSEICKLCDFTTKQLKRELESMVAEGLLTYESGLYRLTDCAIEALEEKGLENSTFEELQRDTMTLRIREEKLGFDKVFIPIDFKL